MGEFLGKTAVYDASPAAPPKFIFAPEKETPIVATAFSRSSRYLAVGRGDHLTTVHRLDHSGAESFIIDAKIRLSGLAFVHDDQMLVAAGDESFRVWDLATHENPIREISLPSRMMSFALSKDGQIASVGGLENGEVHVINLDHPQSHRILRDNGRSVRSVAVAENSLATGDANGGVCLWSLAESSQIVTNAGVLRGITRQRSIQRV